MSTAGKGVPFAEMQVPGVHQPSDAARPHHRFVRGTRLQLPRSRPNGDGYAEDTQEGRRKRPTQNGEHLGERSRIAIPARP
jgi:hypothetical protein